MNDPFAASPLHAEITAARDIFALAGPAVMEIYRRADPGTIIKKDGSPVTEADLTADRIVRSLLTARFPNDAILTEEVADDATRLNAARCWIVDPIDGTQQFVEHTDNFDILIALVDNASGRPIMSGSLQPATGLICLAIAGGGAWVQTGPDAAPLPYALPATAPVPPRVGTAIWFGAPGNAGLVASVGQALGGAVSPVSDIGLTPRIWLENRVNDALLGARMGVDQKVAWSWDVAAGDLFLHEAGGAITNQAGERFRYNLPSARVGGGFVAAVNPVLQEQARLALRDAMTRSGAG